MRLLFDQNLSFKLVRLVDDVYPDSIHVRDLQLVEADDLTIWRYAAEHDLVLVSKDSDFHQMSLLYGHPPKTVWLRVGNAPTSIIGAAPGASGDDATVLCGPGRRSSLWCEERPQLRLHILTKLQVADRTQAIIRAREAGMGHDRS